MTILWILVSLVLTFLWSWVMLWLGASVVGSTAGSWKNCAVLTGIIFAMAAVFGVAVVCLGPNVAFVAITCVVGLILVLFRVTMKILEIDFIHSIALWIVMVLLEWGVSFVVGMLERIWPALSVVTEWLPI